MKKFILLFLSLILYSLQDKTKYSFEKIEEIIPKFIISNYSINSYYKIFKYTIPYNTNSESVNISLQISLKNKNFYLYLYDNYDNISQDINGNFIGYNSEILLNESLVIIDNFKYGEYYFVFFINSDYYSMSNFNFFYCKIVIINEVNDIFNLSPILSDNFEIFSRIINKTENIFYCFNETKYALIQFIEGKIIIKENDFILYENETERIQKLFEFKKDQKYNIYFQSTSTLPIHIQFYNESFFFKHDFNERPLTLLDKYDYKIEIDISEYNLGEYILLEIYGYRSILNFEYQFKNDFKQNNYIKLGTYYNFNYIPIKKNKNDSSLLLNIIVENNDFSLINIYKKTKIIEITSDVINEFEGPQLFLLDYYTLNKLNSF